MLDVGLDLALTGFSSGEIDVILKSPADPEDEVIPAVPVTPRTRPGDIWSLASTGSAAATDAISASCRRWSATVLRSPPPSSIRPTTSGSMATPMRPVAAVEYSIAIGEMSEDAFRSFLADTLGACARVSRDGAVRFVCIDWRHLDDVAAVGRSIYGEH